MTMVIVMHAMDFFLHDNDHCYAHDRLFLARKLPLLCTRPTFSCMTMTIVMHAKDFFLHENDHCHARDRLFLARKRSLLCMMVTNCMQAKVHFVQEIDYLLPAKEDFYLRAAGSLCGCGCVTHLYGWGFGEHGFYQKLYLDDMSSKYSFSENDHLYFVSFAVVEWVDVFTRKEYKDIIVNSLRFCQQNKGLELYAWVIMSNHIHLIVGSATNELSAIMRDMKKHTSSKIKDTIESNA